MKPLLAFVISLAFVHQAFADDAESKSIAGLVPAASGMRLADLDKLATSSQAPKASDVESQSLTLILLTLKITEKNAECDAEFAFTADRPPKPSDLATEMARYVRGSGKFRVAFGPVTMIQADRIKAFTCNVDGDKATGTISYAVPDLYAGKVDYVASRHKESWRIDEFHLPVRQIRIHRSDDGIWKRIEPKQKP